MRPRAGNDARARLLALGAIALGLGSVSMLIWVKLRIVETVPRRAVADPAAQRAPASEPRAELGPDARSAREYGPFPDER